MRIHSHNLSILASCRSAIRKQLDDKLGRLLFVDPHLSPSDKEVVSPA